MTYVDGFVAAVPMAKKTEYIEHARKSWGMFKKLGALSVVENWGDDVNDGVLTSFPMAVKKQDDEAVVFSWITWPSKEARDEAWGKMMSDEAMMAEMGDMPFDGKRMIYGGFQTVLSEKA